MCHPHPLMESVADLKDDQTTLWWPQWLAGCKPKKAEKWNSKPRRGRNFTSLIFPTCASTPSRPQVDGTSNGGHLAALPDRAARER